MTSNFFGMYMLVYTGSRSGQGLISTPVRTITDAWHKLY